MVDPLRLLLLEDNPDDAALNQRALRKAGIVFTAQWVDSREAFIAALEDFQPDIVLADYHLPSFDGLDALALVREKSPDMPYIFVSGVMGEEFAVDSIKRGATDYVLKDKLARLPIAVQRAMEEAKLRTQRRAAQESLREQSLFQASLLDSIPVPVFYKDCEGRYLGCNRAYEEEVGLSEAAIVGKTVFDIAPPEIADKYHAKDLELFQHPGRQVYEWVIRKPSGEMRNIVFHKATFLRNDGTVGGLIGAMIDITELQQTQQALRETANRQRMLIENSPMCIHEIDLSGRITSMNRAGLSMLGVDDESAILGRPYLDMISTVDRERIAELLARAYAGETCHFEFTGYGADGQIFQSCFVPIKNENSEVGRLMGISENITLRKSAEDEIKHLAFYDPLTQLPNRRLLLDRLQQAVVACSRNGRLGALLFIDLDNFKTLNDTLGHDIGDLLLQQVAQRLAAGMREGDTVARLGGDEFVVMLEDLSENAQEAATQTTVVGEKVIAALNQPYMLAGNEHRSTPSIGVTLFGAQRETVDELLKHADLAMYQAKAAGRNTLRFYDPEMQAAVTERAVVEIDLRQALLQNEFRLYYQPQVDENGRITGAEALVRWQHPRRGLLVPSEFIHLAEETGLILPLGNWVLETGCNQLVAWAGRVDTAHLTLAVNVSARQFHRPDFVEQVLTVLARSGADPRKLKLELTESLLLEDVEDIIGKMTTLKSHGVGFSLDDFGTGYSSLSYLKRLPLDQLKIDRSFVRDILTDSNDAVIARTIVALARSMGLEVIAEGVETEGQRDLLALQNCHSYQGYLFSRPVSAEQFESRMPAAPAVRT